MTEKAELQIHSKSWYAQKGFETLSLNVYKADYRECIAVLLNQYILSGKFTTG